MSAVIVGELEPLSRAQQCHTLLEIATLLPPSATAGTSDWRTGPSAAATERRRRRPTTSTSSADARFRWRRSTVTSRLA
jgi:hypothetical protein